MPFSDFGDGRALAQAIVDTVREPLLVLDKDLRVVAASRSFYLTLRVNRQETQGRLLYALGDGQWDIPALRTLIVEFALHIVNCYRRWSLPFCAPEMHEWQSDRLAD